MKESTNLNSIFGGLFRVGEYFGDLVVGEDKKTNKELKQMDNIFDYKNDFFTFDFNSEILGEKKNDKEN